jgi:hypothetical protein
MPGCRRFEYDFAAMLDGALLTDAEMKKGPKAWAALPDPFVDWDDEAADDAAEG